ncbi:hypothetical protein FLLO111716_12970 [Flavobacterium longum]|uniref:hypothetical protein n=1 Tax=Flavobacterium longum TaxID=1299340 RepID=UPI0039ED2FCA
MKYLALFSLFLLLSCGDDVDDQAPCDGPEVAGLKVIVTDAITSNVLTDGVSVQVQEGAFTGNLTAVDGYFLGLYDQQGSYTLTVSKAGYQTYTEDNVAVFKPGCHSLTTNRAVALQPE